MVPLIFDVIYARTIKLMFRVWLTGVRPQMVDFGSEQGLSYFETGGIVGYVEDFKRAKTPLWAKRCLLWMDTDQPIITSRRLKSRYL